MKNKHVRYRTICLVAIINCHFFSCSVMPKQAMTMPWDRKASQVPYKTLAESGKEPNTPIDSIVIHSPALDDVPSVNKEDAPNKCSFLTGFALGASVVSVIYILFSYPAFPLINCSTASSHSLTSAMYSTDASSVSRVRISLSQPLVSYNNLDHSYAIFQNAQQRYNSSLPEENSSDYLVFLNQPNELNEPTQFNVPNASNDFNESIQTPSSDLSNINQEDINRPNEEGITKLMDASRRDNLPDVHRLLNAGANVAAVTFRDRINALMLAIQEGHTDVAEVLISHSSLIDLYARDFYGCSAMDYAEAYNREEIKTLLKARGITVGQNLMEGDCDATMEFL